MKITKLDSEREQSRFVIEDAPISFLNALRRACSFEIPVLAIEDVYFIKNSSALYDEIIAHRLGLIPLKTDLKTYNFQENCSCKRKGCAKCQLKLTLNIKGPCMVYAKDLRSTDPSVKPVYPDMPIVELIEGQELELEAIAILGRGGEHSKWSACLAYYQRYPKIIIKKGLKVVEGAKHCPRGVFDIKGSKIMVKNLLNCDLCKACENWSDKTIIVDGEKNKYIFTIENWGQLSTPDILLEAINIIRLKIKSAQLK